jgi:galactokinase
MADEVMVRYGSAGVKIADTFMELVPTAKVRVKATRGGGGGPTIHLIATEAEMDSIYQALQERLSE